jgi:hypothetical protein
VAIQENHRGYGLSHRIVAQLLTEYSGRLFATTDNERMKKALVVAGFTRKGHGWKGHRGELSLWLKD